jgi:hypothetical protein
MNRLLPCLSVLLLAACGADPDATAGDAGAAGGLVEAECRVLAERHRDYSISVAPPGQEETMRQFVESGMGAIVDDCTAGEMFDREAYDCVMKAPAGSPESHACITAAHQRG